MRKKIVVSSAVQRFDSQLRRSKIPEARLFGQSNLF